MRTGETASLALTKGNKIHLPVPLKLTNEHIIQKAKSKDDKLLFYQGYVLDIYFLAGRSNFPESCHHRDVAKQPA